MTNKGHPPGGFSLSSNKLTIHPSSPTAVTGEPLRYACGTPFHLWSMSSFACTRLAIRYIYIYQKRLDKHLLTVIQAG